MRKIFISGAANRIGREMALGFAKDGWHILLHYNQSQPSAQSLAQEIQAQGGKIDLFQANLANLNEVDGLIAQIFQNHMPDCILHNASYFEYDNPQEFNPNIYQQALQVNLLAPIRITQAFYQKIKQENQKDKDFPPSVLFMLDYKLFSMNPDYFSYSLSKAGLKAAMEMMAMEFYPDLRVNGIAPGLTLQSGAQAKENYERVKTLNPLKHVVRVEDLVKTALYITHAKFNGEIIKVDCGLSLLHLTRDPAFL